MDYYAGQALFLFQMQSLMYNRKGKHNVCSVCVCECDIYVHYAYNYVISSLCSLSYHLVLCKLLTTQTSSSIETEHFHVIESVLKWPVDKLFPGGLKGYNT